MNANAEQRLELVWASCVLAPYQRIGLCATCGERGKVCGRNTDSLVCLGCFTGPHKGKHPNLRRGRARQAAR